MDRRVLEALWKKSLRDFPLYAWGLEDFKGFAFTQDEHDHDNPIKPLPDRPHLRTLNDVYEDSQRLVLEKSRQLMVSWFFCSRILHDCFSPGRRWLVTCKKEEDADALLGRMWVQYQNIPEFLRPPAAKKEANLTIMHEGAESRIQAAAQNTDAPRSFTFSGIWIDEASFTDNIADLVTSAGPTAMAGGKIVLTTTPVGRDYVYGLLTDHGRLEF